MHWQGIVIGLVCFLTIGLFHPLVIKGEYYFGVKIWRAFLLGGLVATALSLFVANIVVSAVLGVIGFSCFWGSAKCSSSGNAWRGDGFRQGRPIIWKRRNPLNTQNSHDHNKMLIWNYEWTRKDTKKPRRRADKLRKILLVHNGI